MSTFPTLEGVLFHLYQFAGLNVGKGKYQSMQKERFTHRDNSLETQHQMFRNLIDELFSELGLDSDRELKRDLLLGVSELYSLASVVENGVYTFGANKRQIAWSVLRIFYVPWISRKVAFWNIRGAFDPGMPGGRFWFLPHLTDTKPQLEVSLPVANVCRWLLDLMGEKNAYKLDQKVQYSGRNSPNSDTLKRNLYGWLNGRTIASQKIHEYFSEDADVPFNGAYCLDGDLDGNGRYKAVCQFIREKELTPEELSHQIPMSQSKIDSVLNDSASETDKKLFYQLVAKRWKAPRMAVVRQKLLFARLVQHAYTKLLNLLCPEVSPDCSDLGQNKVLQLAALFMHIYNATMESYHEASSDEEADRKFMALLRQHPFHFYLEALNTQLGERSVGMTCSLINMDLRRRADDCLPNMLPFDEETLEGLLTERRGFLKDLINETSEKEEAINKVRVSLDKNTAVLQCSNVRGLTSIYSGDEFSSEVRNLALSKAKEMSLSEYEVFHVILAELHAHLNLHRSKYQDGIEIYVEGLLCNAESHPYYDKFEACVLQYRGKHLLSKGMFECAADKFSEALDACRRSGYGDLKGEIARDLLALKLLLEPDATALHERLFKITSYCGMLTVEGQTVHQHPYLPVPISWDENTRQGLSEYFIEDLFRPYKGVASPN